MKYNEADWAIVCIGSKWAMDFIGANRMAVSIGAMGSIVANWTWGRLELTGLGAYWSSLSDGAHLAPMARVAQLAKLDPIAKRGPMRTSHN